MTGYDNSQDAVGQVVSVPTNTKEMVLEFIVAVQSLESQPDYDLFGFDLQDASFSTSSIDGPYSYDIYSLPKSQWLKGRFIFNGAQLSPMLGKTVGVMLFATTDSSLTSSVWMDNITLTVTDTVSETGDSLVYLPCLSRAEGSTTPPPTPTDKSWIASCVAPSVLPF